MKPDAETRIRICTATSVGALRTVNEDAFLVASVFGPAILSDTCRDVAGGLVLGVFDGCGGVGSGRNASDLAAEVVLATLRELGAERCRDALGAALETSLEAANRVVFERASDVQTMRGMGTTATVAACVDGVLHLAHVGDSRAYVLRNGRLTQVSRDQTLLNKLIVEGRILPEEIADFPHKNVILHAVGTSEAVAVDCTSVSLRRGDVLLLCTDGVHGQLTEQAISDAIVRDETQAPAQLVHEANLAGGHDNATLIVARFLGDWLPPAAPEDVLRNRNEVVPAANAVSYRSRG